MAAANRSRFLFYRKMARKCLPTPFKVNALAITDEQDTLFQFITKSQKWYDMWHFSTTNSLLGTFLA